MASFLCSPRLSPPTHISPKREFSTLWMTAVSTKKTSTGMSRGRLRCTDLFRRYGAVVRGTGAYIPPGARRHNGHSATSSLTIQKTEIPKVSVNAPDGALIPQPRAPSPASSSKAPSPAPTANPNKVSIHIIVLYTRFFKHVRFSRLPIHYLHSATSSPMKGKG